MKRYDVIIVGAGPAGLKCAERLSNSNLKVLLLEQKKEIGDKVCAGAIRRNVVNNLKIPKRILENSFNQILLKAPLSKTSIKYKKSFIYTISRKKLGQFQLRKINESKIKVITGVRVNKIYANKLVLSNKEEINYNYLVGADGSNSSVRKYLNLRTDKVHVAIQYKVPLNTLTSLEIFYDTKLFHSWYSWIFPHKRYASVGFGFNPNFICSTKAISNFKKWLNKKGIDISELNCQAHTLNYAFRGYNFGNIFLIGDAAGLASGLTGEGIHQAIVSGEEIARLIIDKTYYPRKLMKLIKMKKFHEFITNSLIYSGPMRPLLLEIFSFLLKRRRITNKIINIELSD